MSRTRSPGRSPSRSKSTVSTGRSPGRRWCRDGGAVRVRGCGVVPRSRCHVGVTTVGVGRRRRRRDGAPAEELLDARRAGGAHGGAALGVVEQRGEGLLELADVAGGDQVGAQRRRDRRPRGSRRRARPPAAWRRPSARRSAARSPRSSEGTQASSAEPISATSSASLTPWTKRDVLADAEPVDELLGATARGRLGDQHQLDVALGAQLGEGLQQRGDALHRGVGAGHGQDPARHPRRGRRHEAVVDAEQDRRASGRGRRRTRWRRRAARPPRA